MKTEACERCAQTTMPAYPVQRGSTKDRLFVCPNCLPIEPGNAGYRHGGSWNGARH